MGLTDKIDIVREYQDAPLPDKRLQERLKTLGASMHAQPNVGFPKMFATDAEQESFYRFVGNDRIDWQSVLEPHIQASISRAAQHQTVVVAHDTSEFRFGGQDDRAGLTRGRFSKKKTGSCAKQGFLGHFALAVAPIEHRPVLGVLGMYPWARQKESPTSLRKEIGYRKASEMPSEQDRWGLLVNQVADRLGDKTEVIHVMDSEADDYALLADMSSHSNRFVVRMCYDRLLAGVPKLQTREFVAQAQPICTKKVKVPRRRACNGSPGKRNLPRKERNATLEFRAAAVDLRRPNNCRKTLVPTLRLHIVRVCEIDPPQDVEPLEWLLVTTEPIETKEDIFQIVEYYRCRWRIEEFFKAIKTGCAYEKRQLESLDTLLVALAMFVPVAWRLLHLRLLSHCASDAPADAFLSLRQIEVLRLASKKPLPCQPTVQDVLMHIAHLGGHIKRNGPPGWQTLGRGFIELLTLERGFVLASQLAPTETVHRQGTIPGNSSKRTRQQRRTKKM